MAARRKRLRRIGIGLAVVAVLLGACAYAYKLFLDSTEPVITTTAGTARTTVVEKEPTQRFDEQLFSLELPADWKQAGRTQDVFAGYKYQSAKKNAENRFLTVYVDNLPLNRPVNKAVAVRADGVKLKRGQISEQCTDIPDVAAVSQGKLVVPAAHDGVNFLCDNDNIMRNVAGTSSPDGVNKVTLAGPGGTHNFFFTYEDNNFTPDYMIFYDVLDSFRVK